MINKDNGSIIDCHPLFELYTMKQVDTNLETLCSVNGSQWTQYSQNPENLDNRYGLIAAKQMERVLPQITYQ